jgi:hypothetical protein
VGPTLACPLSRWRGRIHASEGRRDPRQRRARPGAGPRASVRKSRWRDLSLAGELPAREPAASLARGRAECAERSRLTLARTSSSARGGLHEPRCSLVSGRAAGCPAGRGSRGGRERDQSPTAPESRVLPLGQCRIEVVAFRFGGPQLRTPGPGHMHGETDARGMTPGRPKLDKHKTQSHMAHRASHMDMVQRARTLRYKAACRKRGRAPPRQAVCK